MGAKGFLAHQDGIPMELTPISAMTYEGLQLGAKGVAASVARSHVVDVVGADDVSIALTLDADNAGGAGEVFRLNGSFIGSVTSAGEFRISLFQQGGPEVSVITKGAHIGDNSDDVVIRLADNALQIWVDGKMLGEKDASGVVGGATGFSTHGLTFGNPWGQTNFNGDLKAFGLSVGEADFLATPRTVVIAEVRNSNLCLKPSTRRS